MVPVRRSDFEELIVDPEDTLAVAIIKTYVRLPILWYKFYRYIVANNRGFTTEFKQELCDLNCPRT